MGSPSLDELNKIALPLLSPHKSPNLGPFIVALILDTLLCGVLLMQCGAYVGLGKSDRPHLKAIVAYVLAMNVAITIYTWVWIYDLFVYNFGSYGLFLSLKYLSQYYILDSVTVIVVQGFFATRAWKVAGRSFFVLGLIVACMLTACGGGLAVKIVFMQYGSTLHAGDVRIPAYIWLFGTVASDLLITGIILWYLFTNKTGVQSTDNIISRLTGFTFASQLPPTLIAIGLAIEYSIQYSSFIAIPFLCVQAKFYGISLLHTLNSREALKTRNTTSITDEGDIEFARRSQTTFWLKSRLQATSNRNTGPRAMKGDTHRHTQFTIMPEPRTQRIKAESIDSISLKGIDLGPDEDDDAVPNNTHKITEVDISQAEISELDIEDEENRRPRRGGRSKLASMGITGGEQ